MERISFDERCREYIGSLLGQPIDESKLEINSGNLGVRAKADIFHQLAQVLGLTELNRGFFAPWYYLTVPNAVEKGIDSRLVVALHHDHVQLKEFQKKYGGQYRVI